MRWMRLAVFYSVFLIAVFECSIQSSQSSLDRVNLLGIAFDDIDKNWLNKFDNNSTIFAPLHLL